MTSRNRAARPSNLVPGHPLESDLIPYTASLGLQAAAVLVLAPHPDDEVFGCGGAIAGHVQAGNRVDVVILTDGAKFGATAVRAAESVAAASVLGYGLPDFWSLPDRGLQYSETLVQRLVDRIASVGADLVYAPSPWEIHPDHRQTTLLAVEAVKRASAPVRLAFYEVGSPLRPNLLLDITAFVEVKEAAMCCFGSQLTQQDYRKQIGALNTYRTYTLPQAVRAAEAYWVLTANELDQVATTALFGTVSPGLSVDAVSSSSAMPRVSILIRSMDRAMLAQALDSVALQTYPNIEVVVLAVRPDHRPLPTQCGPFALRLLQTETALLRSRAANLALTEAKGDFLLFLDDDDWLMPGHIARLANVLIRQPQTLAAYTGISLVNAEGQPMGQAFDLPFDAIRQLAGNLMPIHAVLFSANVIERGCRFDEALDCYEDWDFWLQLARLAPMVHLPGVSGAYRIHDSSGVHSDAGPAGISAGLIYQKWESAWTPQQIGQMMQRVWSYPEMQAHLADTRQQLALAQSLQAQHQQVVAQQAALAEQTQQIELLEREVEAMTANLTQRDRDHAALLNSRSWRMTRPLRWLWKGLRSSTLGWMIRKLRSLAK